MPACTVYVAMLQLFGRGAANVGDFNCEVEVLACQKMIAIDGDVLFGHGGNGDDEFTE